MEASFPYRVIIGFFRLVVRIYFRRVEVSGLDNVPPTGGGIVVAWHPNGLIDPGLILTHFPRTVAFGARHGLFNWPVLGHAMRAIGTVPIYRSQDMGEMDKEARRQANRQSLAALAERVAEGSFSCLFPEGTSHDHSHPLEIKSGAAHLYYQARQVGAEPPPVILPVGLHYDHKRLFRSEAHVIFHPPLVLPEALDVVPDHEAERELAKELTGEIERVLHEVARATDSWELHFLMRRCRKLVRAERAARSGADPGRPDLKERSLGFVRVWTGYQVRHQENPELVDALVDRVREYHEDMRALGLEDHQLDHDPKMWSPWLLIGLVAQMVAVFFLLPPLLLIGYVVNLPTMGVLWLLTRRVSRKRKDEATVKVLVGMVAFPLTWIAVGVLTWWAHTLVDRVFPTVPDLEILAGVLAAGAGAAGGFVALRYWEIVRETARAVRVRFTKVRRRQSIARLKEERALIFEQVMAFAEGLDLPGLVDPTGRVVEASDP